MLKDFERLYLWRKRRFLRSPEDVLVVLPKELDIPSMKQYYRDIGVAMFPDVIKYFEYFGGRKATAEDELEVIDFDDQRDVDDASKRWLERGVDTKKIGVKEFVPIEETIQQNGKELSLEQSVHKSKTRKRNARSANRVRRSRAKSFKRR